MGREMKGTSLYLTKRGCVGVTSSFAAKRTNLFHSYLADRGMGSVQSKTVSLYTLML